MCYLISDKVCIPLLYIQYSSKLSKKKKSPLKVVENGLEFFFFFTFSFM